MSETLKPLNYTDVKIPVRLNGSTYVPETSLDLLNERLIMKVLQKHFRWDDYAKLSLDNHIDFVAFKDNKIVAYVEVKCRNYNIDDFDEQILNESKWNYGIKQSDKLKVPFIYAIRCKDNSIYYLNHLEIDISKIKKRKNFVVKNTKSEPQENDFVELPFNLFHRVIVNV